MNQDDFIQPALDRVPLHHRAVVAAAFDAAVMYGALQSRQGGVLHDSPDHVLKGAYEQRVEQVRRAPK